MCFYRYLHYVCGCTHRIEEKCELSVTPFTDIFCPNLDMAREDRDGGCAGGNCPQKREVVTACLRDLQLNVRRINGLVARAKIQFGQLEQQHHINRQEADALGMKVENKPEWAAVINQARRIKVLVEKYEVEGQKSLLEMARMLNVPPTGKNLSRMLVAP